MSNQILIRDDVEYILIDSTKIKRAQNNKRPCTRCEHCARKDDYPFDPGECTLSADTQCAAWGIYLTVSAKEKK